MSASRVSDSSEASNRNNQSSQPQPGGTGSRRSSVQRKMDEDYEYLAILEAEYGDWKQLLDERKRAKSLQKIQLRRPKKISYEDVKTLLPKEWDELIKSKPDFKTFSEQAKVTRTRWEIVRQRRRENELKARATVEEVDKKIQTISRMITKRKDPILDVDEPPAIVPRQNIE